MRPLLVLFSLAACSSGSASVQVDGIDAFGAAPSAIWLVTEPVELWTLDLEAGTADALGPAELSPLNIRDYLWSCAADEAWLVDWTEASARAVTAIEEGDDAALCEAATDLHAVSDRKPDAWHVLSAGLEEIPAAVEPEEGTSEAGGALSYNADDGDRCRAWDPDACAYTGDDSSCGDDDRTWFVGDGELVIDAVGIGVHGSLAGTLVGGESGGTEGAIEVTFDAAICEIPPLGDFVLSL